MMTPSALDDAIRDAWSTIPAPPEADLQYMSWGWGEPAFRAFAGVAPMDVDIKSAGFYAATPLLDLPPRAAAAYLGTYLLSLTRSLKELHALGAFADVITVAHILTCLHSERFWAEVIQAYLPPACREVLLQVVICIASEREAFAISDDDANTMLRLANRARSGDEGE